MGSSAPPAKNHMVYIAGACCRLYVEYTRCHHACLFTLVGASCAKTLHVLQLLTSRCSKRAFQWLLRWSLRSRDKAAKKSSLASSDLLDGSLASPDPLDGGPTESLLLGGLAIAASALGSFPCMIPSWPWPQHCRSQWCPERLCRAWHGEVMPVPDPLGLEGGP